MDWNDENIKKAGLLARYLQGSLSEADEDELARWLEEDPAHEAFLHRIEERREESLDILSELKVDPAWEGVRARLVPEEPKRLFRIGRWLVASAVLLILAYTVYRPIQTKRKTQQNTVAVLADHDVAPGKEKAFLTLGDGSVLVLDELPEGAVQADAGIKLTKEKDQVSYLSGATPASGPIAYNNLTTPAGGYFRLVLPDSSRVWLNAASSLRFPVRFGDDERRVVLEGEAFFEVASQYSTDGRRKRFVVETGRGEIEVLGTRFNVLAYPNEPAAATLLEGSVSVSTGPQLSKVIRPGQQAVLDDRLTVKNVDVDEAVAWKNGYFHFRNRPLSEIARKLERWYGVEIDRAGVVGDKHFTCSISRDKSLSSVLKMLEQTGEYHFELKNGKVKITEAR
ncbi:DUF4974 domain-containing protein [Ravibacter arvi]|uniref:DUF4974 domain-containing protein n=1 Tax=Ravibacter arvi TaxID=2051041 RepID=A0ABP8M3Z1_9BACT